MKGCLIISSYSPRQCGIATYSNDLRDNLPTKDFVVKVAAVSELFSNYEYPPEVVYNIRQNVKADYLKCAHWVNRNPQIDAVIIQHEYGLFGGDDGEYILELAANLKIPMLVVAHTVLPYPSSHQASVFAGLTQIASGVACMTRRSRRLLEKVYNVPKEKIFVIPHGVPNFVPEDRETLKAKYSLTDRRVISTFGLIGPGKGLEIGLKALSRVVDKHPETLYLIAGGTHPALLKNEGETYRRRIEKIVTDQNLSNHVKFINRFLTIEEIGEILYMSDIYLSPYPNRDQAVSGPLSFAVGCGRAVISTPYEYALELLRNGRGFIAADMTAEAIGDELEKVLDQPDLQSQLEKTASRVGKYLTWDSVGTRYGDAIAEVIARDQSAQYQHNY